MPNAKLGHPYRDAYGSAQEEIAKLKHRLNRTRRAFRAGMLSKTAFTITVQATISLFMISLDRFGYPYILAFATIVAAPAIALLIAAAKHSPVWKSRGTKEKAERIAAAKLGHMWKLIAAAKLGHMWKPIGIKEEKAELIAWIADLPKASQFGYQYKLRISRRLSSSRDWHPYGFVDTKKDAAAVANSILNTIRNDQSGQPFIIEALVHNVVFSTYAMPARSEGGQA